MIVALLLFACYVVGYLLGKMDTCKRGLCFMGCGRTPTKPSRRRVITAQIRYGCGIVIFTIAMICLPPTFDVPWKWALSSMALTISAAIMIGDSMR